MKDFNLFLLSVTDEFFLVMDALYVVYTIKTRCTITYRACISKVRELAGGGSATNRATPSSFKGLTKCQLFFFK